MKTLINILKTYPIFWYGVLNVVLSTSAMVMIFNTVKF